MPAGWAATDEVRVVATIKPLHSLVSGVMSNVAQPHLLIRGTTSPHNFSLRPSDAKILENADVVFLIGEAMETSVARSIGTLAANARVVELAEIDGLVRRPLRAGGNFDEQHEHAGHGLQDNNDGGEDPSEQDATQRDDQGPFDLHVWLDPANGIAMVREIAETLAGIDSANSPTYSANAATLQQRLMDLNAEIASSLAPIRGHTFIVFHDAYQHFEDRFGVVAAGSAVVSTDRSPGVRRIRELQSKVRDLNVKCVMSEPQFDTRLVQVIIEGTDAKAGSVDPLGATIDSGPELYFALLRDMAASFKNCLPH